ncbi:MAG: LDH2 family malate/lactate/ureidoglycolate dehydrogenase [Arenicella sp.]|jgi:LDH2 family malate/lactate/ureidoglycolate dehydrogenase
MHVSHSELNRLIKQAFEGSGLAQGVYQAAATSIVWAETHGFLGLDIFETSLKKADIFDLELSLSEASDSNAQHMKVTSSAAFWGRAAAELCIAKAVDKGEFELTIEGGYDHVFMLNRLSRAADKNLYASLTWSEGGRLIHVTAEAGRCCVDYCEFPIELNQVGAKFKVSRNQLEPKRLEPQTRIPPSEIKKRYSRSLDQGIEMSSSLWNTLTDLASNVLVQSTEQSRSGAGD